MSINVQVSAHVPGHTGDLMGCDLQLKTQHLQAEESLIIQCTVLLVGLCRNIYYYPGVVLSSLSRSQGSHLMSGLLHAGPAGMGTPARHISHPQDHQGQESQVKSGGAEIQAAEGGLPDPLQHLSPGKSTMQSVLPSEMTHLNIVPSMCPYCGLKAGSANALE